MDDKIIRMNVCITEGQRNELRRIAYEDDIKMSAIIRDAIDMYLGTLKIITLEEAEDYDKKCKRYENETL